MCVCVSQCVYPLCCSEDSPGGVFFFLTEPCDRVELLFETN